MSRRKQVVFVAGAGSAIRADCQEAGSARGSSAIRVNREEAGRYGERGHGSERGSERSRGSGDHEEATGSEEARTVRRRGARGSERAHITSENERGSAKAG